jgi:hypothetical protein
MSDKYMIAIRVRCISRATKEFFDRDFWLDLSTVTPEDRALIEQQITGSVTGDEFRRIRHLMHEGEMPRAEMEDAARYRLFGVTDYFEDEGGTPLDEIGLAQIMSGQEYPIMPGNVRSVLRLGPTGIVRKELWTTEAANTLAHFYQLVEIIGNSEWLRSGLSISTPAGGGPLTWINAFECPDLSRVYAVLLPIRQLYSEDNAFNHACNVYLKHAEDRRKLAWVKEEKRAFDGMLKSNGWGPHRIDAYTVQDLLNLVMYGAGLVHYAKSDQQTQQNFKDVLARHPREWVVWNFIWYCRQVYDYAARVYFVLRQDHEHWTANEGCSSPDLVFMRRLFESHRLVPDTAG